MRHYTVIRGDRAAEDGILPGMLLYAGNDMYGLASDDTRVEGIEHRSYSRDPSGEPFFTMPRVDAAPSGPMAYAGIP